MFYKNRFLLDYEVESHVSQPILECLADNVFDMIQFAPGAQIGSPLCGDPFLFQSTSLNKFFLVLFG